MIKFATRMPSKSVILCIGSLEMNFAWSRPRWIALKLLVESAQEGNLRIPGSPAARTHRTPEHLKNLKNLKNLKLR